MTTNTDPNAAKKYAWHAQKGAELLVGLMDWAKDEQAAHEELEAAGVPHTRLDLEDLDDMVRGWAERAQGYRVVLPGVTAPAS